MRLILAYAFSEINLYCLYTIVASIDERILQFYKEHGFVNDVCQREAIFANGRYWDKYTLSILQDDWIIGNSEEIK